ncbi:MAG TPA: zinc-binding dehydrogenase [Acidimicrobiales bacterium]|nr:zinc-binding dehydrogenase [Acidimicrobiales bacterium]
MGLSAIAGSRLYSPSSVVAIDMAASRLEWAKQFGAAVVVNNAHEDAIAVVRDLTGGLGADVTIEDVGTPPPSSWPWGWRDRWGGWPTSASTVLPPPFT